MDTQQLNFKQILEEVKNSQKKISTYPEVALDYLGVSRRGWKVVDRVNDMLEEHEVICEPDFGTAWFYGPIEIKPKPKVSANPDSKSNMDEKDPTPRLNLLTAANLNRLKEKGEGIGLISVTRDTRLIEATTLMIYHDFSQLPIINGTRTVEGVVSWKSIGRAISLGKQCLTVSDCKEDITTLNYDDSLFHSVKVVLEKEVVLVRQKDGTISGIVTATDIGQQFISMAEPFLLIEQIENHVRKLLDKKFDQSDLTFDNTYQEKPKDVKSLSDLNFGQYVRLLENPQKFEKLKLNIDRGLLTSKLEEVRKIRNDVMHFDPDGISPTNLEQLRQILNFLHTINATLKIKKQ